MQSIVIKQFNVDVPEKRINCFFANITMQLLNPALPIHLQWDNGNIVINGDTANDLGLDETLIDVLRNLTADAIKEVRDALWAIWCDQDRLYADKDEAEKQWSSWVESVSQAVNRLEDGDNGSKLTLLGASQRAPVVHRINWYCPLLSKLRNNWWNDGLLSVLYWIKYGGAMSFNSQQSDVLDKRFYLPASWGITPIQEIHERLLGTGLTPRTSTIQALEKAGLSAKAINRLMRIHFDKGGSA
jgi:hypothetical protein